MPNNPDDILNQALLKLSEAFKAGDTATIALHIDQKLAESNLGREDLENELDNSLEEYIERLMAISKQIGRLPDFTHDEATS